MARMPRDATEYRATLLLFFEEEIMGEAMFAALAEHFTQSDQRRVLVLLSRMERRVAETVRLLLDRDGLKPRGDDELHEIGRTDSARYRALSWPQFLARIETDFPVFLDEFAALTRVAPEADRKLLRVFDEHEIATIDFARREREGDPHSLTPLTDFIAAWPVSAREAYSTK